MAGMTDVQTSAVGVVSTAAVVEVVVITGGTVVVLPTVVVLEKTVEVEELPQFLPLQGLQWNLTWWIPTLHFFGLVDFGGFGLTMTTSVAPPHWVFLTTEPFFLHDALCLQIDLSGMV
jgi:hypothetical protein